MRRRLVGQFLGESFVYAALSLLFALLCARLLLPTFRVLAGRELSLEFLQTPSLLLTMGGVLVFVGLTAGSDKDDLDLVTWGDMTIRFVDNNNAAIDYAGADGSGRTNVVRLTNFFGGFQHVLQNEQMPNDGVKRLR